MPPTVVVTDSGPLTVRSPELNVPLLVVSPVSAVAPPTAPPKLAAPPVFTVRVCAPFTVEPKPITPPPLLASVALAPSVTAPL
ncbi:hypothetical protein RLIN73S_02218 [Rhodanobacter lindaniclasticus]